MPAKIEILIVSENRRVTDLLSKALGPSARTQVIRDGEEALAFLRRDSSGDHERPRLVILDYNISSLSGEQVLRSLKSERTLRRIPVILLCNPASPREVLRSYELKANACVEKSAVETEFLSAIKALEGFWCKTVLLPPVP